MVSSMIGIRRSGCMMRWRRRWRLGLVVVWGRPVMGGGLVSLTLTLTLAANPNPSPSLDRMPVSTLGPQPNLTLRPSRTLSRRIVVILRLALILRLVMGLTVGPMVSPVTAVTVTVLWGRAWGRCRW